MADDAHSQWHARLSAAPAAITAASCAPRPRADGASTPVEVCDGWRECLSVMNCVVRAGLSAWAECACSGAGLLRASALVACAAAVRGQMEPAPREGRTGEPEGNRLLVAHRACVCPRSVRTSRPRHPPLTSSPTPWPPRSAPPPARSSLSALPPPEPESHGRYARRARGRRSSTRSSSGSVECREGREEVRSAASSVSLTHACCLPVGFVPARQACTLSSTAEVRLGGGA